MPTGGRSRRRIARCSARFGPRTRSFRWSGSRARNGTSRSKRIVIAASATERADTEVRMQSTITEIAADTFRISTFAPDYGIQFNQFLIRDDEPFLMHTGLRRMFPVTLAAVRSVLDPA